MPNATVTLSTTTLNVTVEPSDNRISLASTSGIVPGVRLFLDRELLAVETLTGVGTDVIVRRGVDGTTSSRHATNTPVYIGRADQFYSTDPIGLPPNELPVYPYINVVTGDIWAAEGDESGPGVSGRIWSKVTRSIDAGALGTNVVTTVTPS